MNDSIKNKKNNILDARFFSSSLWRGALRSEAKSNQIIYSQSYMVSSIGKQYMQFTKIHGEYIGGSPAKFEAVRGRQVRSGLANAVQVSALTYH